MQKRPHPIRVGLEIQSLPTLRERLRRTQAIKLLAKEGRLCWYSNTLLGYCVKIGMLPLPLALKQIEAVLYSLGDRGEDLLAKYFSSGRS